MADSVKNLEIWQDGMNIVKSLYKLTQTWPKEERYGLTSQVRRAAVSIPANIAEGVGRGGASETAHFSRIALGSLYELQTLTQIAHELRYFREDNYSELDNDLSVLAKRISSYISYQENRKE